MGRMPYVVGASAPVTTATTPERARAREVSIFVMRACGCGECRILPTSMPGTLRSSVYLPWPVVFSAASTKATGLPIVQNSDISRRSSLLLGFNRRLDRLEHLHVAGTAAQVSAQRRAYIVFRR